MHKNVLVLVPHPDDAEFYAGGTLAKWALQGAKITVVVATDGGKGSLTIPGAKLVAQRKAEAIEAAARYGAQTPIFLDNPDFELDRLPPGELRAVFLRILRQLRPDAIVAQDAFAADDAHPDHRAVAWAAVEAIQYATLPLVEAQHAQAGLSPHFVLDKYYYSETNHRANYFVDISDTLETKIAALGCHRSQVEFMVADIQNQLHMAGKDLYSEAPDLSEDPMQVMAYAMRQVAAATGKLCQYLYAEAFRHERFNLYPFDFN